MTVLFLYPKEIITRAIMIMTDMPDGVIINPMSQSITTTAPVGAGVVIGVQAGAGAPVGAGVPAGAGAIQAGAGVPAGAGAGVPAGAGAGAIQVMVGAIPVMVMVILTMVMEELHTPMAEGVITAIIIIML